MSVVCEKTGCEVYLAQYSEWVRGDSYRTDHNDLIFRINPGSRVSNPLRDVRHYTVYRVGTWFDAGSENTSTMFVSAIDATYHGHAGLPEPWYVTPERA